MIEFDGAFGNRTGVPNGSGKVTCDADPNAPESIPENVCLMKHLVATKQAITHPDKFRPCLKCPVAIELKAKKEEMKKSESVSVTPSPEEVKPWSNEVEMTPKSSNKPGSCKECGQTRTIIGRGVCGSCYHRLKKAGNLEKYPASVRVYQTAKPESETKEVEEIKEAAKQWAKEIRDSGPALSQPVSIGYLLPDAPVTPPKKNLSMIGFTDFLQEVFPDVHQYVTDKANAELRDTEMQVIWYLRNAMEKGL